MSDKLTPRPTTLDTHIALLCCCCGCKRI